VAIDGAQCLHAVHIGVVNVCGCLGLRVLHECDMVPLVRHFSAAAQRSVNGAVRLPIVALKRSTTRINEKIEAIFVGKRRWPRPEDRGGRVIG
jgi:hypothetical protein